MKKAVILFSGGLDSSTVLAIAKAQNFDCYPISFHYGQRHSAAELTAAKRVADYFAIKTHKLVNLPTDLFGASALTSEAIAVPQFDPSSKTIPVTYVPARNTIFLAIALGYAESIGCHDLFIGTSEIDYSGYPDCRPEFLKAFEQLANLATKDAVEGNKITLHTPLVHLSKAQTIQLGIKHGVDYALTVSCYQANAVTGAACGRCDSCSFRKKGFEQAGVIDPTLYFS